MKNNDFQDLAQRAILHDVAFVDSAETFSGNKYDYPLNAKNDDENTLQYYEVNWDKWRHTYEPDAQKVNVSYPGRQPHGDDLQQGARQRVVE